ncbi:MAG: hypothetical protein QM730_14135 [Anaerolineales bacterium]
MTKNARIFLQKNGWLFPIGGAVIGLIMALMFFKKAYCFYAYQTGGTAILAGLAGVSAVLGSVIRFLADRKNNLLSIKESKEYIYLISGMVFTGAMVILLSPFFYQFDKNSCVKDFDKLVALTEQEGTAVIREDMHLIKNIYMQNAIVTRSGILVNPGRPILFTR